LYPSAVVRYTKSSLPTRSPYLPSLALADAISEGVAAVDAPVLTRRSLGPALEDNETIPSIADSDPAPTVIPPGLCSKPVRVPSPRVVYKLLLELSVDWMLEY